MLNLQQIADHVCQTVRHTDEASVLQCKAFTRSRFEMIWNDQLWKDSLVQIETSLQIDTPGVLSGTTTLPDKTGVKMMPDIVDYVVAVRTSDRPVVVTDQEYFFTKDGDSFDGTGTPLQFYTKAPVCVDMGEGQERNVSLQFKDQLESGTSIYIRYRNSDNELIELTTNDFTNPLSSVREIEAVTKATTTVRFELSWSEAATDGDLTHNRYIEADETHLKQLARIQLIDVPSENTAIRVLAKRRAPRISSDYDTPRLRGVEPCLLAFVQADMLEHGRQYAKSDAKNKEGIALLDQLKSIETKQMASNPRLIPVPDAYEFNNPISKDNMFANEF